MWDFFAMFVRIFSTISEQELTGSWGEHDPIWAAFDLVILAQCELGRFWEKIDWRGLMKFINFGVITNSLITETEKKMVPVIRMGKLAIHVSIYDASP